MLRMGIALLALVCLTCDGFVGEVDLDPPTGPPIKIVDPDYVILRPVSALASDGLIALNLDHQTLYFNPADRILDLRHLDPRTAKVEESAPPSYLVSIRTTPEGDQRLGDWTSANLEKQLGVFVDGRLISAPFIKSKITGVIVFNGDFSKSQADAVLARLRRGGAA